MTLTFELDTELARVFDFVTEYKGDDKNDLFLLWKGTKSVLLFSKQAASDTVPVEIEVEPEDIGEFNYLCKYENVTPDAWFEARVRDYCVKGLSDIQAKIRGTGGIGGGDEPPSYPLNPGRGSRNQIPDAYWHYLVDYGRRNGRSSVINQYEIAFRCRIAPKISDELGEDVFQIDDIDHLDSIYKWVRNNMKPVDATAFNNYLIYRRNGGSV